MGNQNDPGKNSLILLAYFSFRLAFIIVLTCNCNLFLQAQKISNSQLWTDYLVDYPFKKVNLFQTEFSYRTLLSNNVGLERWHSFSLAPTYERSVGKHVNLITTLRFFYTLQNDTLRSFEVRPILGIRFFFTPDFRLQTKLTLRYEHRFLTDIGEKGWLNSTRVRVRPELTFPINKESVSFDNMLYALTDVEFFFTLDQNVKEVFSNRIRSRFGLGYRFSYNFRLEGI